MKKFSLYAILACGCIFGFAQKMPKRSAVINSMQTANHYFMKKYSDPTAHTGNNMNSPSNIWTRGVYFEGLMALYNINPEKAYLEYAKKWANFHNWNFASSDTTRNAEDLCCAQTYIDLYKINPEDSMLAPTRKALNHIIEGKTNDGWNWIDAIQMGMPVFAKMGNLTKDMAYFRQMMNMYLYTRNDVMRVGLYNPMDCLWWRDKTFLPPYKEPNGKNCYWSRGNGWVYAALVRSIDEIDAICDSMNQEEQVELLEIRKKMVNDFVAMSLAIKKCRRKDFFWNVSLHDATHWEGKETTGTALFVYGMAWGARKEILAPQVFAPIAISSWEALAKRALHKNGFLGYVQGIGKQPKDGQPISYDKMPDYEDYGLGCFLLAGSEIVKLIEKN